VRKTAITQRDFALLLQLLDRRCESLEYLKDRYFGGVRNTAINRLRRLELAGYLQRHEIHSIESPDRWQHVYTLGPAARAAVRHRDEFAYEDLRGRRFAVTLPETSMPHQIATNRVGDWLGAHLIPEHLLPVHQPGTQRHRPDAVYRCVKPDADGRQLVFLEVDLGHYRRDRVLGKVDAFLANPQARSILFVSHTEERRAQVAQWITDAYGEAVMDRVQPLTIAQIREGGWLDAGTEPDTSASTNRRAA
jgi:hypothetical protein